MKLSKLSQLVDKLMYVGQESQDCTSHLKPYIMGNRGGFSVIDLEKTLSQLRNALSLVQSIVYLKGTIMVIDTRVDRVNFTYHNFSKKNNVVCKKSWSGGNLTNYNVVNKFGVGVESNLPDVLIVFGGVEHLTAIVEANKLGIPVVGVIDTDSSLIGIDYPILCNSNSLLGLEFYSKLFMKVISRS